MLNATRTDRHRADPTKVAGIVYTPPALARFLASRAFNAIGSVESVRILDPACGDGELLLAACQIAEDRGIRVAELVGYDIDPHAIDTAAARLDGSTHLYCEDFLDSAARWLKSADIFDPAPTTTAGFDLVVSNPPYVRTQTLGTTIAQSLGRQFGLTGRVDLYQAFAIAMILSLAPNGALGLLCSNKFLTNRAGSSLRKFLLRELVIEELIDLGDTKLFDAAVLPVVISGRRRSNGHHKGTRRFRSIYQVPRPTADDAQQVCSVLTALSDNLTGLISDGKRAYVIRDGQLDPEADPRHPWNPVDTGTIAHFQVIRRTSNAQLKDLAKVRVGIKTTADSVFIRSDWAELPDQIRPEPELLRPLITHRDVRAWSCEPGSQCILYPHGEDNGRTVALDLTYHPRASAYLEQHRDRLASRKYIAEAGRQWFEVWVPQKPSLWSHQKVVFPDISESPKFSIDRSGALVNGDCYWMVVDDDDLAEVITAVGNSNFCTWFYDVACGNFLYAGRRRFMTQYIERLPIPDPKPDLVSRIREYRSEGNYTDIDKLVWLSLGFEEALR